MNEEIKLVYEVILKINPDIDKELLSLALNCVYTMGKVNGFEEALNGIKS